MTTSITLSLPTFRSNKTRTVRTTRAFTRLLLRLSRMPNLMLFKPTDFDFRDLGSAVPR